MKTILFLIAAMLIAVSVNAQNLLDIYQNGNVKLVEDTQFGSGNNWDEVFETYADSMSGEHIGRRKSLVILPDGSFVVNHAYRNYFTKFSADGRFLSEFSIRSSSGRVQDTPDIIGVLNNEILFTGVTNYGKMFCSDLEGNLLKTLDVNYMARRIIPLPNKKFAIVGWVIWETKFRDFLAIKDYETGEEKIIWDHFVERTTGIREIEIPNPTGERSSFIISSPPVNMGFRPNPFAVLTPQNEILLTIPPTGEMIFFGLDGEELRSTKVTWENEEITEESLQNSFENSLARIKNYAEDEKMIVMYGSEGAKLYVDEMVKELEQNRDQYIGRQEQPYFSTVITDSDNNILFFEYPIEEGGNNFNVYTFNSQGNFVCKSSLICDNYNLEINQQKLVFRDGFLYGLQEKDEVNGIPMRLVKFKLEVSN